MCLPRPTTHNDLRVIPLGPKFIRYLPIEMGRNEGKTSRNSRGLRMFFATFTSASSPASLRRILCAIHERGEKKKSRFSLIKEPIETGEK